MSTPNNNHPPHRRKRPSSTVRTLATTAVVAYGAYKVYEYFNRSDDDITNDEAQASGETSTWNDLSKWMSSWLMDSDVASAAVPESTTNANGSRSQHRVGPPKLDARTLYRLTQQSVRKCREESIKAYGTCWSSLQHVIDKDTDTAGKTQELRQIRKEAATPESKLRQDALWREIQLETLTRLISTEYASCLLLLSLTMQLHWIGGQVFQHKHGRNNSSAAIAEPRWAHEVMMESHQYMTQQGLPLLIAAVRRSLSSSNMREWTATTFVSKADLEVLLGQIDQSLERGGGGSSYRRNWIRLVLPDPSMMENNDEDEQLDDGKDPTPDRSSEDKVAMLESLWDLAESPAWQDAQVQTLQVVKQYVRDQGWGQVYSMDGDMIQDAPCAIPLAKLMAPFKTACGLVALRPPASCVLPNTKSKSSMPHRVQKLTTVLELGEVSFHAKLSG
jgi:hypothetical protein